MRYYNTVLKIVFLTNIYFKCVYSECITAALDSQVGECKMITECETIPFFKNVNRTRQQRELLKESGCGFHGLIPKICCPLALSEKLKECEISNDVKGECRDARNCTVLKGYTLNEEAYSLLRKSCKRTDDTSGSICCPTLIPVQSSPSTQPTAFPSTFTSTSTTKVVRSGTCQATSLPPQPNSGCCGKDVSSPKILGGYETEIDQYPWLVLLEYRDIDRGTIDTKCGGSLISGRYVLTAAHCVHNRQVPESVRLGEHDTRSHIDCVKDDEDEWICNDGSESILIQKIIVHPLHQPVSPYWNDIALLRLNRTVNFSDFIAPICLPSASATVPSNLYVAGWGATNSGYPSPVKMQVVLPYVDLNTCKLSYPRKKLWPGQICAGGEIGKDSCKGDSGAPLMRFTGTHYEVLGIVSFGKKFGQTGSPAVHTRVSEYLHWIRTNMHE